MNFKKLISSALVLLAIGGANAEFVRAAMSVSLVGYAGQFGTPVGIPSSGTFANNGALSGLTAFPNTYNNGIYLFFPANAICTVGTGGNAAGYYWTVMSSTSAGTVYNLVLNGRPLVPTSPPAFTCTGPGAYTQSTSTQTLGGTAFSITGNYLGINGEFHLKSLYTLNSSANTKSADITFGGSNIQTIALTTTSTYQGNVSVYNNDLTNSQTAMAAVGASTSAPIHLAIDTTANQNIGFDLALGNASDFIVLEAATLYTQPLYN